MNKYDEMSDMDINKAVAIALRDKSCVHMMGEHVMMWSGNPKSDNCGYRIFNPCRNPADMWPIILANDISLINDGVGSIGAAHDDYQQVWLPKDKALRAAAIVFLMMKDSTK